VRIFFDTEMIDDGVTITLVSIGMVTEDGRTFGAASSEADLSLASDWVRDNVLPLLPPPGDPAWMTRAQMRDAIVAFVGKENPEFWGYVVAYDWVALCQLFGRLLDVPKGWPHLARDLRQAADASGLTRDEYPVQDPTSAHDALADAHWNLDLWRAINAKQSASKR
jgi:hypothetical protein